MFELLLLIRPRWLGLWNQFRCNPDGRGKRILILGGLGLAFSLGAFALSCRVLIHFQSANAVGDLLARYLLGMIFLTFFSLLIFSHIVTALSNLYLSHDLELCHSAPVRLESIFLSRSVYSFIDSSWMLIIFGLPVFMAYAYVYRPGLSFYVALIHMNVAMGVIAGALGILLTMILVHIFPAQRMRDLLVLLSIVMLVALYVMFRFLRPERLVDPDAYFSVLQYMSALETPQSPYLPSQWVSETLWAALTQGGVGRHRLQIMLNWSTAAALVVINVWVARAVYRDGFSKSQEAKCRRTSGKWLLQAVVGPLTRPFGRDMGAVIAKDMRTFFRDNSQWPQLLLLGALVVVYIYNFSVLPLEKSAIRVDFLQNELAFLNMGLAGFVLSAVSARFVYTAVSAEGRAYWVVRSSPMTLRRYLWGKYLFFLLPMLVLAEVLIIGTNHLLHVTPFMMFLSTATMFFLVLGIVAMGMGLGALYPDFGHQNIAQVATGYGGVVYMILSALFVGAVVVLEAGPVYILFMSQVRGVGLVPYQWAIVMVSFAAVLAIAGVAVFTPMSKGLKALRSYEP